MSTRRLPLFPLGTVLFPGMPLPLHVFEPRYQELVRDCMEADRLFGVCLIRSGREVGGPAEPYSVGTTCEILKVTPLEAGRMHLATIGRERFRIVRLYGERPYLEAEIEPWPETDPGGLEALTARLREATHRYVERALEVMGQPGRGPELPPDPVRLSHLLAALLQAPPEERQQLLEEADLERRLEAQGAMLTRELEALAAPREPARAAARPLRADPNKLSPN